MIEWLLTGNNSIAYMGLSVVAFLVMLIFTAIFNNHEKIQNDIGFFGIFILIQGFIIPIIYLTTPIWLLQLMSILLIIMILFGPIYIITLLNNLQK